MVCPSQVYVEYSVSYFIAVVLGLAYVPWMSPNIISFTHPILGLLAGVLIARAAAVPQTAALRPFLRGEPDVVGDADDAIDYQNVHSLTPLACGRAPARRH